MLRLAPAEVGRTRMSPRKTVSKGDTRCGFGSVNVEEFPMRISQRAYGVGEKHDQFMEEVSKWVMGSKSVRL